MARIGVISDTHGLMRPEALAALRGSDFIVHAGDIGDPAVLAQLRAIAPVTAVRGNNDTASWAEHIPDTNLLQVGNLRMHVLHSIRDLDVDVTAACFAAVISGHSHRPSIEFRDGVLFVNPGSAGPRRFKLPVTVASVAVVRATLTPEIIPLAIRGR